MKHHNHKPWLALCALMLMPLATAAQSLDSCLAMATRHSLTMAVAQKQVERAEAMQGTAFNLPATSLSLSQDFTSGGSPDNGLTVSQDFQLPTVYQSRRRVLHAETELERRALGVTALALRREVASAYWSLVYQRERVRLLTQQDSVYEAFVRLASAKYRGGDVSRLEQLNAERLYQDNRMTLLQAQAESQRAALVLQSLVGAPVSPADTELRPIAPTPTDGGAVASYYAQQEEVARQRLISVRKEALPTFSVGVTGQLLIKGLNPYNVERERFREGDIMAVEVGVSIPLTFGATRSRRRAAQADVELSALQSQQAERERANRRALLEAEAEQAQSALIYYGTRAKEQAADIVRTSTVSYRYGDIGYVEHIQNLQTAISAALAYADAVQQYNQAIINLDTLE